MLLSVPETPINLQSVSRKNRNNLHDIEVTWLKPNLTPDYYLLELDNHPNGNNFNLTQLNVSGVRISVNQKIHVKF